MISKEESYDLFLTTLSRLDNGKLELSDDELSHEIFEELDTDSFSFLHEWTVDRLIEENFIPIFLRERILNLRESIIKAMESKRSMEQYRNDSEWIDIRERAGNLLEEIKTFANKT